MKWQQIRRHVESWQSSMHTLLASTEDSPEVERYRYSELRAHLEKGVGFTENEAEFLARAAALGHRIEI